MVLSVSGKMVVFRLRKQRMFSGHETKKGLMLLWDLHENGERRLETQAPLEFKSIFDISLYFFWINKLKSSLKTGELD